jgi:RimJ/RimL family protein N-acetyltransferase
MPGAAFLEGEKVNLRTIEEEDIEFLNQGINNSDVRIYLTVNKPQNLSQQKEFFDEVVCNEKDVHLGICVEEEIIGIISLEEVEKDVDTAEIGIWIDPEHHGNGYGTEAAKLITSYGFRELAYHRISARAYEGNKGSQKIWEKLGYQEEGELREQTFLEGEYGNIKIYGILENEWRKQ